MMRTLICASLAFGLAFGAAAQTPPAASKEALPSCVPNPKGMLTGHLETRQSPDAPGGRVFYLVGEKEVIIFDLPAGAEKAEPAIPSLLKSKGSVQLSWSGSRIEREPGTTLKLETYTGAMLRIVTNDKSLSCIPVLDPTPMSQLNKAPSQEI